MRISKLETVRVASYPNLCFVRVHTDEGFVGLGETFFGAAEVESYLHGTGAPHLLGRDPLQIERLAQALKPYVGATSTGVEVRGNSALDIALWDILGKVCGQPIYQLLGGASRDSVPVYNTCAGPEYIRSPSGQAVANWGLPDRSYGGRYEDLDGFLHHADELARDLLDSGIKAMKIWPFDPYAERWGGQYIRPEEIRAGLQPFQKIRAAVGEDMDILVELHGQWNLPAARNILRALEEFRPVWVEDPLRAGFQAVTLRELAKATSSVFALSETLAGRGSYLALLEEGLVGVVLADVAWCGGVSEAKKIATLAEAYLTPVGFHDCTGPVTLVASAHLALNVPNAFVQEIVRAHYYGWYAELLRQLPPIEAGHIKPPPGPGLGTELRPEVLERPDTTTRATSL